MSLFITKLFLKNVCILIYFTFYLIYKLFLDFSILKIVFKFSSFVTCREITFRLSVSRFVVKFFIFHLKKMNFISDVQSSEKFRIKFTDFSFIIEYVIYLL